MKNTRCIIALNLAVFLLMFGVGLIVPLFPQKIFVLTGSFDTVGYLASTFAVPFVLLQFPFGRLSDRYGFRRFLLSGYLICSFSGFLYCFSNSQAQVFFGRVLQGVGEAPLWALAPALLATMRPDAKGKVIGIYNASLHMGLTLGSGFGILVASAWVHNEPFLMFALLCGLGACLIVAEIKEPKQGVSTPGEAMDSGGFKRLCKNPAVLAVFSGIILYGAGYGVFLTVLPGFLIQNKGFSQTEIGWLFMFFYVAVSISQLITGPLSDKYGRRKAMICGLVMAAAGLGVFPGKDGWMVYPWLFLTSIGLGMFCVSSLAWLNNSVGDSLKGTVSGAFYLFWGVGYFSGPLILGAAWKTAGGSAGFQCFAILFLVQALGQGVLQYRRGKMQQGQV